MLKKYRNSIVAKTTAIHILIIMAVGTIVLVSLLQSLHVRGRIENTVSGDVSAMLSSAQTGRVLNSAFVEAGVLLASFPEKEEYLNARRAHLIQTIQAHKEKIRKDAAKTGLLKPLEQFTAVLQPLLEQCGKVNGAFKDVRHSGKAMKQELASVETILVERMIKKKSVEVDTLSQLGTMLSVYRETLYQGAIRLEAIKEAFLSGQGDAYATQEEVTEFVKEFHANLMLVNTSGNEFVQHGRRLFELLDQYQDNMLTLVEALDLFQNMMKNFQAVQKKLNREMERFDSGIAETAARMQAEVKKTVHSSLLYITITSAGIMAGLIFLTLFIRRMIAPIAPLAMKARAVAKGGYTLDGNTHAMQPLSIDGNDEIAGLARDIEKMRVKVRKREQALRESRSVLAATLESTLDGVFVVTEEGKVTHHNSRFAEIWSIPEDLLKRESDEEMIAHVLLLLEDPEQFTSRIKELYENFETSEDILSLKDGRTLERHTYPLMQGSRMSGRVWFFRDITERKQMELALKESEERLGLALSGANEGIWDWRFDEDAVYFDSRFYTMAGYRPDEFPCTFDEWEKRVHPDDLEAAKMLIDQCRAGKQDAYEAEFRFRRKDGSYMWIRSKGSIVNRDDRGNPERFVGTHADITELKRTQLELEKFRFTIEQAPDAVFWMDRRARFIYANEQACRSLGYTQKELEKRYLWDIDPFYPKEKYFERWKNFEKGAANDVLLVEATHKRKDGPPFPVEILSKHIRVDDVGLNVVFSRDITRRKQAEEALNKERNRIANILEATNAGTCEWNYQTGEVHLNPRWAGIMGKTLNDLTPIGTQTLSNCAHPDDLPEIKRILDRLISRETDYFDFDFRQSHKDGGWVWVNTRGKVVEWTKDGKPLCISGTNLDITEKKRAEEALHQNYIQLKAIYNTLPVIIWSVDKNGVFIMSEGKELGNIGLEPGQVVGRSLFDLYSDHPVIIEHAERALKGEKYDYITKVMDNFYHTFYTPFFDENHEVQGLNGLAINVTENRKIEEEVRRLRNYFANIIDSMPSVLVGVDPEGRVTQWNRKAEQVTGLLSEQVTAEPLEKVFSQLTGQMADIKTAIRERRVISTPKVSRREEQETRFEDITIYPLAANGVEGAVIRVDDVTEQVHMEEMMIQSEKMLSVGGLAAGMAHEINNPLAGMLQTANVLANRLGAGVNIPANRKAAEAAGTTMEVIEQFMTVRGIPRMLSTISDSGRRVAEIVNNMLNFARKSEAVVSSQDLGSLLDTTLELAGTDYDLKKQYDFKQIAVLKEYADPPVFAPCEAAKIQQVLLNLLRNGAQAMQKAEIESPRFIFRTRLENNPETAVIEIEDNGPGMDKATRKRIFEPFFTTKPAGVGTGLGLSVSYFIITENHRGEMAVESEPGGGAKFIIRLPV